MSATRERMLVAAGVVIRENSIMLCQRRPEVHNGLKWEFPGGKLEPGESPEEALRRELREELSIDVRVGHVADAVYYRYPDRDVLVLFYMCEITEGTPQTVDCNAVEWADIGDVSRYDFAGADEVFVERNLRRA